MIETDFDIPFVSNVALREKQIQQHYRPLIAVHKWFARRPGTLFRGLLLAEFGPSPLREGAGLQSLQMPHVDAAGLRPQAVARRLRVVSIVVAPSVLVPRQRTEGPRHSLYLPGLGDHQAIPLRVRAENNSEFALQLAGELASATSLAGRYAEELLWGIREAHTWDHRMEVIWRLRGVDDSGVHGIAADIIERSVPDLSPAWLRRARRLLYEWATDPDPKLGSDNSETELLQVGINSVRGRVAEALLRVAGEHGLTPKTSEVLRQLAEDGSPAVRACVLGKLGHLRRDHYSFSLDLFERATRRRKDDRVLQYTIWYARFIESKDYQRYVEPVIRRAVQSEDNEVARVGGFLAAWGMIGARQAYPKLEKLLVGTHSAAVIGGAEEVFSANVYDEDEGIARISREWCLRLMKRGDSDIQHSILMNLRIQDAIDLGSVSEILMQAAKSDDREAIRDLLHVLEKGVKQLPNEAAAVLSKLWSRETSQQARKQLHIGELHHKVLDELLQNDDVTVRNRHLAWDIFDALLEAGDAWATNQFDEYVKIATTG